MIQHGFIVHHQWRSLLSVWIIALLGIGWVGVYMPTDAQEANTPTSETAWDLRQIPRSGLFVFYDAPAGASATGKPLDIGDFDGNGCGDIAITGQNAGFGGRDGWRNNAGHVRIVMNLCPIDGLIAMENNDEPSQVVVTIYGAYAEDMAGTETYVADFNNDGYDDLLFGAQNNDGAQRGRSNAGAAYVVLGGPDFANHEDIDLYDPPADVLVFYGAVADDRFGLWVEGGDFDGDGFHDMLIGANQADGGELRRSNAGEVWILYGTEDMVATYGQVTDMSQPPEDATRIIGADYDDLLGSAVWGGDLNNDGYDDAIMSAALWRGSAGVGGLSFGGGDGPGNQRYNSGESFVIFGNSNLRGQTIDLQTRLDASGKPTDKTLTVIYGAEANDLLGEEIATGDLDGDGQNDLVLGTLIGDGPDNSLEDSGEAWVIYTRQPFEGQMFDLADPEPGRTVAIYPDQPHSKGGDTLRIADIDGDGIGDLLFGAPDYDPTGFDLIPRRNAGLLAVIFSKPGGLPNTDGRIILPSKSPAGLIRYVVGADENDMLAYAMTVYDVDGDGVIDFAFNGMGGDGLYNTQMNAGEIYVINGAVFMSSDSEGTVPERPLNPTPSSSPTPTPVFLSTFDTSQPKDAERGRTYYQEACAGCHDATGTGDGVGVALVTSYFVLNTSDEALLDFLRVGRSVDAPDNTTGVAMPPYGGRTDWGEQELWDIIAYLYWLIDPTP